MSWEFVPCRHVPRLNNHHLRGNTDSEIIIQTSVKYRASVRVVSDHFFSFGPNLKS